MHGSGAGEGGPLLGSLRPRSPEKGFGGCALSFSWLGGRVGAATPGAGGEEKREEECESSVEREDRKVLQGHLSPCVGLLMSTQSCLGAQHACWPRKKKNLKRKKKRPRTHHTGSDKHPQSVLHALFHCHRDTSGSNICKRMWHRLASSADNPYSFKKIKTCP